MSCGARSAPIASWNKWVSRPLEPGEFVGLTGSSGSGKSTLLNIIGGLDRPDSGTVTVNGLDLTALRRPVAYRREIVGFVFQSHHLLPSLSVQQNVELPLVAAHVRRGERARRARSLIDRAGLAGRESADLSELSGGERQRVAIARALVHEPRLLLADEPTAALDDATAERVLEILEEARRERGMTMLAVTYDPALIRRTHRMLRLQDGALSELPAVAATTPGGLR